MYVPPPLPAEQWPVEWASAQAFISRGFMHSLLCCNELVVSLFHFIQRQVVKGYSDPKLLEMMLYVIVVMCNFDALHPSSSLPEQPGSVKRFREWLRTRERQSSAQKEQVGCLSNCQSSTQKEQTGCLRDLLWRELVVNDSRPESRIVDVRNGRRSDA